MSGTKTALKAAKVALDGNKYQDAIDQAKTVLKADPKNYHAYILAQITLTLSGRGLTLPSLEMSS